MLRIRQVSKIFNAGTSNERKALVGIDLDVREGDFITIIGSNGAGKSTLLNVVAGVYAVDDGIILLDGKDITDFPEHQRSGWIGRVFQDPMLGTAASMTIEENLAMAAIRGHRRGLRVATSHKQRGHFRDQLSLLQLGLEDRLTTRVGLLSGGQRQALTLLMAIMQKPKVLLLDEHTAALDPKTAQQILKLTRQFIQENGLTALMVTHNLDHALKAGTRTIMMHEGEIVLDVSGQERVGHSVESLLDEFARVRGERLLDDKILLSQGAVG